MASWESDGFILSTDKQYLDTDVIHHFLSVDSYWAKGITMEKVKKSIEKSSICFGMYEGDPAKGEAKQIGFVRAVTDFVRFAWIMDVFVLPEYRGRGLSKWMMETMVEQSELKDVRKMMLCTYDAHGLYEQYGFQKLDDPEIFMQRKI
ncbi:GNAT family N-acetyltransferase [Neobacillus niacini]|jgi:N-acetylglutamate synthase-like GNAT family acetyltransferase|uniref:GNAT family N-acetyltransferase n=1 Tax=Neobacillus niacini TaxID=86668 RepID=UPI001C8E6845|nr:GNAT family N-acetyltransferase [Neobacillus niacini]MBY0147220.1 GNAT family N-acetyltransferase [Neobacillus niacini]